MCGFGGVINHQQLLTTSAVGKISAAVKFRGPDNCGVRVLDHELNTAERGSHAFFFNRLAILDLDPRSNQPFEDDNFLLTFNGEIYNYKALRSSLEKEGISFQTESDTEVLFNSLKRWGIKALSQLNGMFAFAWLDKAQRTLLVCRDRLGIKPLYYSYEDGSFCFSSELHSIVRLKQQKPSISSDAVKMYLWMQFVPSPYSILNTINKLPPGSFLKISLDQRSTPEPEAYWNAYEAVSAGQRSNPQHLEAVLRDTVARQLQADVPIGLFLSAGVDSSLLAAIVNKYFAGEGIVNFFTVAFSEKTAANESDEAVEFIKGFNNPNLRSHVLPVDPASAMQNISELYQYYDEPFGDYASILNWLISIKAREHVTVALSGDGADELFWGYERYNKWQSFTAMSSLPLVGSVARTANRLLPASSMKQKLSRVFTNDAVQRHFDQFLLPGFRGYFDSSITSFPMWALEGVGKISRRSDLPAILDIKTYLADAMLYKVDRASMATSLEVRVPYLDNEVVDYSLNLEFNYKSNTNFKNKAILKQLLTELAPHYNPHKPKRGFSFPLKDWLKNHWKEQVLDSVTKEALVELGLPAEYFHRQLKEFYQNDGNNHVEVWYLFNLVLWKQHYESIKPFSTQ